MIYIFRRIHISDIKPMDYIDLFIFSSRIDKIMDNDENLCFATLSRMYDRLNKVKPSGNISIFSILM